MVKRHRRGAKPGRYGDVFVIRRIFHITFQFIGVLAVGFAIALIAFFWRLSFGPLSIAYFTPYFESALSNEFGKLKIKINDTILTWAGVGRTLEIRLIGAQALGANQKVIAEIPDLAQIFVAAGRHETARPAGEHVGAHAGRIRTHAEDQSAIRPRSLGSVLLDGDGRMRDCSRGDRGGH